MVCKGLSYFFQVFCLCDIIGGDKIDRCGGEKMADNVEDRVMQGINGKPQLKIDEQRRFLGNFRERVIFTLSFQQLDDGAYANALKKDLAKNPGAHLFLNGAITDAQQANWLSVASVNHLAFTFVNDNKDDTPDDLAVVYAGDTAINLPEVDLLKKYPVALPNMAGENQAPPTKKGGFWADLFN